MIYVFKDNLLIWSGVTGLIEPPKYSYIFHSGSKEWNVRYERKTVRLLPKKHVPKELKVLCMLLNIDIN